MTKCYYCGKTDGSHDISCICGKQASSPAMNTASPTDDVCGGEVSFITSRGRTVSELKCETCGWVVPRGLLDVKTCPRPRLAAPVSQGSANPSEADKMLAMRAESDLKQAAKRGTLTGQGSTPTAQPCDCMGQCPKCRTDGVQGSATSGEAKMALNLNAFQSYDDYAIYRTEIGRLSAALAASAEQSNSAAAIVRRTDMGITVDLLDRSLPDGARLFASSAAAQSNSAGSARQGGITSVKCHECKGRGLIGFLTSLNCSYCKGTGKVVAPVAERAAPVDKQVSEMKWAAIEAHRICYETMLKYPGVTELGDDGVLHMAIHAIVGVCTPNCSPEKPVAERAAAPASVPPLTQQQRETIDALRIWSDIGHRNLTLQTSQDKCGVELLLTVFDAAPEIVPASVPEGFALVPDAANADDIVTRLYRRFKDWSKRGFGPDDVTWCEVKADVLALLAAPEVALPAAPSNNSPVGAKEKE